MNANDHQDLLARKMSQPHPQQKRKRMNSVWEHFTVTVAGVSNASTALGKYGTAICNYCEAFAKNATPPLESVQIEGRPRTMLNHLNKCPHFQSASSLQTTNVSSNMENQQESASISGALAPTGAQRQVPLITRNTPEYQTGFGNTFESEAIEGALPRGRDNPRKAPFDFYTEQISGSAFSRPGHLNQRTWLYRHQPSAVFNVKPFQSTDTLFGGCNPACGVSDPNPLRWKPLEDPGYATKDFLLGTHLLAASGEPATRSGLAIYMYIFQLDMKDYFYNSDGDFLIVPQEGSLRILTEMGILRVKPTEICVIPRGITFTVQIEADQKDIRKRGYILEVFKGHFALPELGRIGTNGLVNARDFQYPIAWFESSAPRTNASLYNKFCSTLWSKPLDTSPLNVVAWHGTYLPYKYDLSKFCAVNSVKYDHIDPSVYTVLSCLEDETGKAFCDFVVFPHRWMATDSNTFRPLWFHRNTMTEFIGLLSGEYDAKKEFSPGAASLHSCMTPHGPDSTSYDRAVQDPCDAQPLFSGGLAFMFETSHCLRLSKFALEHECLDTKYGQCWRDLPKRFGSLKK